MKQLKYLLSLFLVGVLTLSFTSCGGDDDDEFGGGSDVLAKGTIGIYDYLQTDYATWSDNGMFSNSLVTLLPADKYSAHSLNISIDLGRGNAPFDEIKQGDTFECGFNYPLGVREVNIDFKRYTSCVSGKITCTKKTATTMILTLSNVIMERSISVNSPTKERCEINGTLAFKK